MPPNVGNPPLGKPDAHPSLLYKPNTDMLPLAISITLTSIRGGSDIRNITLRPGEPCLIGRASRSTLKHLDARGDNALFDCPVISREHAELRASLWDVVENQISITDKGSMHGTRVNGVKLRQGSPKTLRSGDTIQLGEKVTRGDSTSNLLDESLDPANHPSSGTHDGIFVTFSTRRNSTQAPNTNASYTPAGKPSGVYCYPYSSEEESDYGSDDNTSVFSDKDEVQEASSPKTTPEQVKAKLGSQESPIELDQPEKSNKTFVQDSLDAQASVIVPESLPGLQGKSTGNAIATDLDSDDESVIAQPASAAPPRAGSLDTIERWEQEQHGSEVHNNDDAEDDGEAMSDSEASDLNHYSQAEDSDEENDEVDERQYRPISPKPVKEPSPEFRSSGQVCGGRETYAPPALIFPVGSGAAGSHLNSLPYPAPVPTYQPYGYSSMFDTYTHQPATFTNAVGSGRPSNNGDRFAAGGSFNTNYYSVPETSRWDKPPSSYYPRVEPPATYPSHNHPGRFYYAPPSKPLNSSNTWNASPMGDFDSSFATDGAPNNSSPQSPKIAPTATVPPVHYTLRSPRYEPALASSTSRISIPDIVDNEPEMEDGAYSIYGNVDAESHDASMLKEAKSMVAEAKQMVEKAKEDENAASMTHAASAKRKLMYTNAPPPFPAQEMPSVSDIHDSGFEVEAPETKKAKLTEPSTTPTFDDRLPTPPSKLASVGKAAFSIAKYATVASAGGLGMLAFLCSPASDRVLEWLP